MKYNKNITFERLKQLFDYNPETGIFTRKIKRGKFIVGSKAGTYHKKSKYYKIFVDGKIYARSRLAFLFMTGNWPKEDIDHKNGKPYDDRWCNLREATKLQNTYNRLMPNKHNVIGIQFRSEKIKKPWRARIRINGKRINLGHFSTKEEAMNVYQKACEKLHGEFAYSNRKNF